MSLLFQAEGARPITLTTPVDVNGLGDPGNDRAVVNGVQTILDQFRGTPYVQADLRVSRPFTFHDRWSVTPFIEFFNLFNRNNPGANYVTDIGALPTPVIVPSATLMLVISSMPWPGSSTLPEKLFIGPGATTRT